MNLLLSSAALPGGTLGELCVGAERRDLSGLEVVVGAGHAHGIEASCEIEDSEPSRSRSEREERSVQWLLIEREAPLADALYWGRRAHLLGSGVILTEATSVCPAGLPVALLHSTEPESAQRAAAWARMHEAQTCWEVRLGAVEEKRFEDVLDATAPTLAHVRLLGAGPESQSDAPGAVGTGAVLKALALEEYSGTVALAPSEEEVGDEWRRWLFDERGWGCNTAAKKRASRSDPSG